MPVEAADKGTDGKVLLRISGDLTIKPVHQWFSKQVLHTLLSLQDLSLGFNNVKQLSLQH